MEGGRKRERQTDRQTDRDRQEQRERQRQRGTETERDRDGEKATRKTEKTVKKPRLLAERQRQIGTERETETERDRDSEKATRKTEKTVKKPRLLADPNTHKCLLPEGSGGQDVAKVPPADNAQVTVAEAERQQRCVVAQALTQVHGPLIAKPARAQPRGNPTQSTCQLHWNVICAICSHKV